VNQDQQCFPGPRLNPAQQSAQATHSRFPPPGNPHEFQSRLAGAAVGAFAIGTTEFAPMGLLPVIADGVGVGIPTAGMLITAYAVGVMLGAPVMTLLMGRFGKRTALMLLMSIFVVGNLLSALAPNYGCCCCRAWSPASTTVPSSASVRWSPPAWCRRKSRLRPWPPCSWA
jgi:MFS family permease